MFTFLYIGDERSSYGYAGRKLAIALAGLGLGIELVDVLDRGSQVEDGAAYYGEPWRIEGTAVGLLFPEWLPHVMADRVVVFTMYEGFGLPADRVRLVNEYAHAVVVPSVWCESGFRMAGVRVPVARAPLGVCPGDYPLMARNGAHTQARPYRFLWNGPNDGRKGWEIVYQAFWRAFQGSDDVELVLHFRDTGLAHPIADGNVRVVAGYQSRPIVRRMLRDADCYVFPSKGEGWGLPPREAAATGLPVIATDYSGLADGIRRWALPLRGFERVLADMAGTEDELFEMAVPDVGRLAEMMRWCYEHKALARARGLAAARWLRAHGTWRHAAERLVEAVQRC